MKRLLLLLSALLECGLIAAGCGDDDDDGGDDSPAATTETPLEIEPDDGTPPEDVDSIEEAVEACKEGVRSSSAQLSEDLRNDLEDICEQAAEGDEEEIREASLDICRRVVEETLPEGAGRDQALDACEASVPTP